MIRPMMDEATSQDLFKQLREICVPLMKVATTPLDYRSSKIAERQLRDLISILRVPQTTGQDLKPSLVGYIFAPLMTILRRNPGQSIPDQVLEMILKSFSVLSESWWWTCQVGEWEQLFMFCGSLLGEIHGDSKSKGKDRARSEETKAAAIACLCALLLPSFLIAPTDFAEVEPRVKARLTQFQSYAELSKFLPVLGQTLDWVLDLSLSPNANLQGLALDAAYRVIAYYLPEAVHPTVLPGVISTMSKVALGFPSNKGFASSKSVEGSLRVMAVSVVRAIGDTICLKEGAIHRVQNLEDLFTSQDHVCELGGSSSTFDPASHKTARTPSWVKGTASQVHIALNALSSLITHPKASALRSVAALSFLILTSAAETLLNSRPLMVSWLLTLSVSSFPNVSHKARAYLHKLLEMQSNTRQPILAVIADITKENLAALPRLIMSAEEAKIQRCARLITSSCRLATTLPATEYGEAVPPVTDIAHAVGHLLGPTGGIEKWGYSLLSVLEFEQPDGMIETTPIAQITLDPGSTAYNSVAFPWLQLRRIPSKSTQDALAETLRSLGMVAESRSLFSVEWFIGVDQGRGTSRGVAALWCAGRLLEGICGVELQVCGSRNRAVSRQVIRAVRNIVMDICNIWEESEGVTNFEANPDTSMTSKLDENHVYERLDGLITIRTPHEIYTHQPASDRAPQVGPREQPVLYHAVGLQFLSLASGALESHFISILPYATYPVLQSIVSHNGFLSQSGMCALRCIAFNLSFANPANLLLSNFDYALDGVARHLTKRNLDLDASKALAMLVRLVGPDVVTRAGDVVDMCFDRLDEFHGYEVVVDGLVAILHEVVTAIEPDGASEHHKESKHMRFSPPCKMDYFREFYTWFGARHLGIEPAPEEDYGPAPHEAWSSQDPDPDTQAIGQENATDTITPTQDLTRHIVLRSIFFLTHASPSIRRRILSVLTEAVPILPSSAMMPAIHKAWPYILNRLGDREASIIQATASLIEVLTVCNGELMYRRVWDDVWPRMRSMLSALDNADRESSLAKRSTTLHGAETRSVYTHSHRLHRAILRTMTAVAHGVRAHSSSTWDVIRAFRRFLHAEVHAELQDLARNLYIAYAKVDADSVWLALHMEETLVACEVPSAKGTRWNTASNVQFIMEHVRK